MWTPASRSAQAHTMPEDFTPVYFYSKTRPSPLAVSVILRGGQLTMRLHRSPGPLTSESHAAHLAKGARILTGSSCFQRRGFIFVSLGCTYPGGVSDPVLSVTSRLRAL